MRQATYFMVEIRHGVTHIARTSSLLSILLQNMYCMELVHLHSVLPLQLSKHIIIVYLDIDVQWRVERPRNTWLYFKGSRRHIEPLDG
jgi:hypothetical protein